MSEEFKPLLALLADGATLSEAEAQAFFTACLRGEPTPAQVAAAATAMRLRGETVGEIAACARAMRSTGIHLEHEFQVIDTCGTGGDGLKTLNISTAAAILAAAGGLKVAKHGNRAMSSRSGSSDVLSALGVNVDPGIEKEKQALAEANLTFLFAPAHHGAMRHVSPIRQELGFRTVFNLLGPLSNPAGAQRQVLGVYDLRLVEPIARVLGMLGCERAWVVHGSGMDELSVSGPTHIAEWRKEAGGVRLFTITPEAVGMARSDVIELRGGDSAENAQAIRELLSGKPGPYRDVVCLNAAAAFLVGEKSETLREGVDLAREVIDDGRAQAVLDRLVAITNAP